MLSSRSGRKQVYSLWFGWYCSPIVPNMVSEVPVRTIKQENEEKEYKLERLPHCMEVGQRSIIPITEMSSLLLRLCFSSRLWMWRVTQRQRGAQDSLTGATGPPVKAAVPAAAGGNAVLQVVRATAIAAQPILTEDNGWTSRSWLSRLAFVPTHNFLRMFKTLTVTMNPSTSL